jgi:hypothetical protein
MPKLADPPDAAAIFRGAAEQLAPMVITWQTILLEHVPNAAGYCTASTCGMPGRGTPNFQPWPCGAASLATYAQMLHRRAGGRLPQRGQPAQR